VGKDDPKDLFVILNNKTQRKKIAAINNTLSLIQTQDIPEWFYWISTYSSDMFKSSHFLSIMFQYHQDIASYVVRHVDPLKMCWFTPDGHPFIEYLFERVLHTTQLATELIRHIPPAHLEYNIITIPMPSLPLFQKSIDTALIKHIYIGRSNAELGSDFLMAFIDRLQWTENWRPNKHLILPTVTLSARWITDALMGQFWCRSPSLYIDDEQLQENKLIINNISVMNTWQRYLFARYTNQKMERDTVCSILIQHLVDKNVAHMVMSMFPPL